MADADVVKRIISDDSMREVLIVRRQDGFFMYYEQLGLDDQTEYECHPSFVPWPKMEDRSSVFQSAELAEADAYHLVTWLVNKKASQ